MDNESTDDEPKKSKHANRHIPKFLALPSIDDDGVRNVVQLVGDGRQLTSQVLMNNDLLTLTKPMVVLDTPESIGMKVPKVSRGQEVTVRDVADLIGHHYPVHVIDVEHQEELEGWTLADLVDYFEDEERLLMQHRQEFLEAQERNDSGTTRRRRKAAKKCMKQQTLQRPRVLNQISLEFSKTPLSQKILSPQFVRELDWIDHAWPRRKNVDGSLSKPLDEVYPNVQYYCLTSAAGCYTDFHVDFGGTAVWYHILNGKKDFCLIPPTKENLAIYEQWLCRPDQAAIFLPDLIPNPAEIVFRISLQASQTLIIPTAWIHAVYTPSDSLVIGGNFLHGMDISLQLEVHCIETRTRVKEQLRFPFFLPLNFYAGGYYLQKLRQGQVSQLEVDGLGELIDALEEWWKVHSKGKSQLQTGPTVVRAAEESARQNGCDSVEDFLSLLRKEYKHVVENGIVQRFDTISTIVAIGPKSPSKPKLKLSLKGKAPLVSSVRSVDEGTKQEGSSGLNAETTRTEDEFRIVVSSSNLKVSAVPPTRASKRPREDTDWIDDGLTMEDEWVPGPKAKVVKKTTGNRGLPPKRESQKPKHTPPTKTVAVRKPTKALSIRQKLMQRMR